MQLAPDGSDQIGEQRKVLVVRTELAGQLPDTLDRIQVRTVGREESTGEPLPVRGEKRLEQRGVMVPGIVQHENEPVVGAAMPEELAQEGAKRHRVELRRELGHELASPEMDGPEQGHGLPRRRVEQHGIRLLGRHPHDAAGAVLLEMAFVEAPEVTRVGAGEPTEFF